MIGFEITSKESGILLFTHEFRPDVLFTDSDIRGGLIGAIMQVMGETFGQQETKIVNYGNYNAILTEGEFVYGVLFTFQTGPIFEKFCRGLVENFESKFQSKLERLMSPDTLIEESEYDFSNECTEAYNTLLHIDETKLSKLLDIIHSYHDRIFENMIIFLRPEMSQIYTHLASEKFSVFSTEVSTAIKILLDLSNRTTFPIENFQIALSKNFHCLMFNVFPYTIVIFIDEDNLDTTQWRIKEIITSFVEG
ncbi:MAG: hypothetical protein ACFFDT_36575 [Candidatus Hodarchaeota archaeon]